MSAVADGDHQDCATILIDAEQDPVVATPRAAVGGQFAAQRFAEPVRIVGQRTGDEFDDGGGDFMGKTLQVALRRPVNLDAI